MSDQASPSAARSTLRPVDAAALSRIRARLARAPEAPWLHGEVARRMAQRLPVIVMQPRVVLDWWARAGASADCLAKAYPRAQRRPVEPVVAAPGVPSRGLGRLWQALQPAPVPALRPQDVPRAQAQLLWANMTLHWVDDPQAEMSRWLDALAVDGFLMFSTLGPGTLSSLRALYAAQRWPAPHAPFVDMHDLGDMLLHAGFSDPVMDQETLTLNWADGDALLSELHALGANADPGRFRGLRTPRWRRALVEALGVAGNQRPSLEFEVIYGHAFRPVPSARVTQETRVELHDMRSILRRQRDL